MSRRTMDLIAKASESEPEKVNDLADDSLKLMKLIHPEENKSESEKVKEISDQIIFDDQIPFDETVTLGKGELHFLIEWAEYGIEEFGGILLKPKQGVEPSHEQAMIARLKCLINA